LIAPGGRALVIGLGLSGLALARFLRGREVEVRACDLRAEAELQEVLSRIPEGVELRLGGYGEEALDGCDAVYASPGVPWDDPVLEAARRRGLPVSSEMDLFFRLCPAPIVGITGTNGKTTTTAMVGTVLARGDRPVMVGGNIGETVLDRLPEITERHWVVLELSSFQLESIERPRPRIGVVLNVTPDHLDRHGSMEAYVEAKARIVAFQEPDDWAVLNGRDAVCRGLAERTRARVVWFDRHQPAPPSPVPGAHNLENARAAAAVGRLAGLADAEIEAALAGFSGVEHRLELVGEWGGVAWYNDSKATNPDAGLVALSAFEGQPLVLIAGGRGSGFDLEPWLAEVRARTLAVVLIGESAGLLAERLAGHPVRRAASMEEAVAAAAELAPPGGVVLLSPGYKSYDMFRSYEDRGRRFKAAVRERLARAGRES
jgi:UDP-N-acetylmuramoylalanine--D-glutamate ligase